MKKILLYISALLLIISSCSDELDKKFFDPDGYTDAYIEFLYTQGASKTIDNDYGDFYTYVLPNFGIYTQSIAKAVTSAKNSTYEVTSDMNRWSRYYTTRMSELMEMYKIYDYKLTEEEKKEYTPYIETGKVLMAFNTMMATDFFGSMPYSEAFTSRNGLYGQPVNLTPKYDTQKDIYYNIFDNLKAVAAFLKGNSLDEQYLKQKLFKDQDIVYAGDYSKWYKFTNSLRLRAAMRISYIDEAKAKEVLSELTEADLITNNADNAYTFKVNTATSGSGTGIWRAIRERRTYIFAPENLVNIFSNANDPRLVVYFQPPSDDNGVITDATAPIVGMPESCDVLKALTLTDTQMKEKYGILNSSTIRNNNYFPNGVGITASDVYFFLAEARQRNLITWGSVEDFYNKGVVLSIQEYYIYYKNSDAIAKDTSIANTDVSDVALLAWLNSSTYKYDASKALKQIATQRWIHHWILQPFESWAEYRRTDLPAMVDDYDNSVLLNQGNAPVRMMYASEEAAMNTENYKTVANDNDPKVKVWWDIK